MTDYEARTIALVVLPVGADIDSERALEVAIVDEGGWLPETTP